MLTCLLYLYLLALSLARLTVFSSQSYTAIVLFSSHCIFFSTDLSAASLRSVLVSFMSASSAALYFFLLIIDSNSTSNCSLSKSDLTENFGPLERSASSQSLSIISGEQIIGSAGFSGFILSMSERMFEYLSADVPISLSALSNVSFFCV